MVETSLKISKEEYNKTIDGSKSIKYAFNSIENTLVFMFIAVDGVPVAISQLFRSGRYTTAADFHFSKTIDKERCEFSIKIEFEPDFTSSNNYIVSHYSIKVLKINTDNEIEYTVTEDEVVDEIKEITGGFIVFQQ